MDPHVGTELDTAACWERLRTHELGRLAYHLVDEVHIVPVNYLVDGERLLFRTSPGAKLLGVTMDEDVAFEIDGAGERGTIWSVVARGRAATLEGDDARAVDDLPLRTWVDIPKSVVVAIEVTELTGREYAVNRQ